LGPAAAFASATAFCLVAWVNLKVIGPNSWCLGLLGRQ
jgi:hypothetical protein